MAQCEHPAVTTFREYIKIKTVQPNPDYETCTRFLKRQGKELGAKLHVMECVPGKPIIIMTVEGRDPTLPSLLLNSHTDVVPVFPEHWKFDPFSGHKDEDGEIYGRGTQDMKSVGMQYLEALKQLRNEEIGGANGMMSFVETDYFRKMNVGLALDEGYASTSEDFLVFYGQRHSYRTYSAVHGGVQLNVVPAQPSVGFDVRVAPTVEPADFESMLQGWCREAGQDVVFEIDSKVVCRELSCVEDGQSPWARERDAEWMSGEQRQERNQSGEGIVNVQRTTDEVLVSGMECSLYWTKLRRDSWLGGFRGRLTMAEAAKNVQNVLLHLLGILRWFGEAGGGQRARQAAVNTTNGLVSHSTPKPSDKSSPTAALPVSGSLFEGYYLLDFLAKDERAQVTDARDVQVMVRPDANISKELRKLNTAILDLDRVLKITPLTTKHRRVGK
ncbi:Aminoacylase-1 [Portunus trituberculatus]|uniref:Aminoacylase-1 n=1 Tax=Portunus trituberculatus TaxID=210409 RepID=A0A5B7FBU4_PORTR|nr:Aminoacylase-1 [Portunus trituberculatus]